MGNVVYWLGVSLDGFMEGPDHDISWHQVDEELHAAMNKDLAAMGAFLGGRRSYELMESYWTNADQEPGATPVEVEFAEIWRSTPKVVYSRTLQEVGPNATLVRNVDAAAVRQLMSEIDGDVTVGGAELASEFDRLDLIDEYRVFIHPVVVGGGTPMFVPRERRRDVLRLIDTRRFGNGVVELRYSTRG